MCRPSTSGGPRPGTPLIWVARPITPCAALQATRSELTPSSPGGTWDREATGVRRAHNRDRAPVCGRAPRWPQRGAVPLSDGDRRERRHRETHEARAPANGVPKIRTMGSNGFTSTPVNPHRRDSAMNAPNPTVWVATAARCGGLKSHPSTIPRGIMRRATRHLPLAGEAARRAALLGRANPHGLIAAPAGQRRTGMDLRRGGARDVGRGGARHLRLLRPVCPFAATAPHLSRLPRPFPPERGTQRSAHGVM